MTTALIELAGNINAEECKMEREDEEEEEEDENVEGWWMRGIK